LIHAIIFDLDNTLTDFMRMKHAAVDAGIDGMLDAGLAHDPVTVKQEIWKIYEREGIEHQQVFDDVLEEILGHTDPKILAAGIVAYRRARGSALVLYPHVQYTLLELIKRGLRLAVISDAPRAQAWLRLASLQLHNLFDHVVTYEDTGARKPSPEPFRKALELLKLEPGQTLMVGDWAERDVVGAAQLGIPTVFARYGDTFDTKESGADYELNDIMDLLGIVDGINNGRHP